MFVTDLKDQTIHVRIAGVDAPEVRQSLPLGDVYDGMLDRARIMVVLGNLTRRRVWHGLGNAFTERLSTASSSARTSMVVW